MRSTIDNAAELQFSPFYKHLKAASSSDTSVVPTLYIAYLKAIYFLNYLILSYCPVLQHERLQ